MNLPSNFNSDRPINSDTEDKLDRKGFAHQLADRILAWRAQESLVLALYGDWGSGKSSTKNLILEKLRKQNEKAPLIVEFNPWLVSGEEKITRSFFTEISSKLGEIHPANHSAERVAAWNRYSRLFEVGAHLAATIDYVSPSISIPPTGIGKWMSNGFRKISKLMKATAETQKVEPVSIEKTRQELRRQFQVMNNPMLVVIDDIDRLTMEEVRLVFRLVKANADFPNIVYLLLFQRESAEKALDQISNDKGREFLEKIVQVGFDLPMASQACVGQILFANLSQILSPVVASNDWDMERWTNLWAGGLSHYFNNIRAVYRFLNSTAFMLSAFHCDGVLEVNAVDLTGVECLRIFEPEVYSELAKNEAILTRRARRRNGDDDLKAFGEVLLNASRGSKDAVRQILSILFPVMNPIWGGTSYSEGFYPIWTTQRRVCTPAFFRRYFALRLEADEVSEATIQSILKNVENRETLSKIFAKLEESNLLTQTLERLEPEEVIKNLTNPLPYILTLMDFSGHGLKRKAVGFLPVPASMQVRWLINGSLRRIQDDQLRTEMVGALVVESNSLALAADLIDEAEKPADNSAVPKIEGEALESLKSCWLGRVRNIARNGNLMQTEKLDWVLRCWREWGKVVELHEWVASIASDPPRMVALIKALSNGVTIQTIDSHFAQERRWLSWKELEGLQSRDFWQRTADFLSEEADSLENEKCIVNLLVESLIRWGSSVDDRTYQQVEQWDRTRQK